MRRGREVVREIFATYYNRHFRVIEVSDIVHREFAIVPFDKPNVMIRHRAFGEPNSLLRFLRENLPLHVYYSSARYKYPYARDMESKEWIGADLVFDIDVDHIDTACKRIHDEWTCLDCNSLGKGIPPEECPYCSSKRIDKFTWICDQCLERAKEETLKLVEDFLMEDFGFEKHEIKIFFSGHRGFHVHIESASVLELNQDARRELIDYLKGIGLKPSLNNRLDMSEPGWRGRIAKGVYFFVLDADEELLKSLGFPPRDIRYLLKNKNQLARALERAPFSWSFLKISHRAKKILLEFIKRSYGVEIDERVTMDIKRLIRLPNSLHGKTGLKVVPVMLSSLEDFNPFEDASLKYYDRVKVRLLKKVPQLILGGYKLMQNQDSITIVPFAQGLYLACKNIAEILDWG